MINITPGALDTDNLETKPADKPVSAFQPSININPAPVDLSSCIRATSNVAKSGGGVLIAAVLGAVAAYYVPKVLGRLESSHSDGFGEEGFETEDGEEYDITVGE